MVGQVTTAGVYARISLDRREGEGIARQLADCKALAVERGWETVDYIDNDVSALRARRRPEFDRLLADLAAGKLQAVVAYHADRLYRRLVDLEQFIDLVQQANADVVTVKAGDLDLSTASGRMVARILGSVARHESERIGERVARAKKERAAQGRHSGGGLRPFGLTGDRSKLEPEEAAQLRRAAKAVLDGSSSFYAEARRMNAEGSRTTTGAPWNAASLRRTLDSAYVAGLREYHGEIIGPAAWPAILDKDDWQLIRAGVNRRKRGRPPADRYLLTGLLVCHSCGGPMYATAVGKGRFEYRCMKREHRDGWRCGRTSITQRIEEHVESIFTSWLEDPDLAHAIDRFLARENGHDETTSVEIDTVDRQLVALAERWADGRLGDDEYDAARAVLARRRSELQAKLLTATTPAAGGTMNTAQLRGAWARMTTPARRTVIGQLTATPIVVRSGLTDRRTAVALTDRVTVMPAWT